MDTNALPGGGCWREISTCGTEGFTVAFWFKLLSKSGLEEHANTVRVVSAMESFSNEGWEVELLNWEHNLNLKFIVRDPQSVNKTAYKTIGSGMKVDSEWAHYVVFYRFAYSAEEADNLFQSYENGQQRYLHAHYGHEFDINPKKVDTLAFGKRVGSNPNPPYPSFMVDELLLFDGKLNSAMVTQLFLHYQD